MTDTYDSIEIGTPIAGQPFAVTRQTIRDFCDASLDYNPLHLDDEYMKGSFGKTQFGGVIMHGMTNFGLLTKMITDWAYPHGVMQRRLETRWLAPVRPGDTLTPRAHVTAKRKTEKSRWLLLDVEIRNQNDQQIARGEAMVEFPIQ